MTDTYALLLLLGRDRGRKEKEVRPPPPPLLELGEGSEAGADLVVEAHGTDKTVALSALQEGAVGPLEHARVHRRAQPRLLLLVGAGRQVREAGLEQAWRGSSKPRGRRREASQSHDDNSGRRVDERW